MAIPTAPSNVRAIAVSPTSLRVTWQDNSNDETGFDIEIDITGEWEENSTVGANVTTNTIETLPPNQTIPVRVRATNGDGDSDWAEGVGSTRLAGIGSAQFNRFLAPGRR